MVKHIIRSIRRSKVLVQIYGYKLVYTLFYFLFQFFIVKVMSKSDFGHFSFYTSVVVYFGSFSLLGSLVYGRRQIAKNEALDGSFLIVPLINFAIGLGIIFWTIPASFRIQVELVTILLVSVSISAITTICNALERYTEQYKMIVWMSVWNLACLVLLVMGHSFSVELLLRMWAINALFIVPVLFFRYRSTLRTVKIRWDGWRFVIPSYITLIYLYLVGFPFEFSRYFDKWIIKTTFTGDFLGTYAFNVLVVTSFVSLFIRPLEGILATELAKIKHSSAKTTQIISRHYIKVIVLYIGLFFYFPFSDLILKISRLEQYQGTSLIFLAVFSFYFLYSLGAPLLMLLNYNGTKPRLSIFFGVNMALFGAIYFGTRNWPRPSVFLSLFLIYQISNVTILLQLVPKGPRIFFSSIRLVGRRFKSTLWIFNRNLLPDQTSVEP